MMSGAGTRNRTADLLITNQSLYQLSYPGKFSDQRADRYSNLHGFEPKAVA